MKSEFTYPSKDGRTQIHAIRWEPGDEPRAVLQIAHGMVEFIERYDEFARFLNAAGFVVVGNDHLGHGASVTGDEKHGFFADPDGNECVIGDLRALHLQTAEKYPDIPYFFLGHSMGSFLARQYIEMYGSDLAGAIIMGTGQQPGIVLALGKKMCASRAKKFGWDYRDAGINKMALGANNKRFEPARTPVDWLSKNEASVDAYVVNPWNNFMFTVNGYYHMFRGIQFAQDKANIRKIPKELPILVTSGRDDPVGAFGKAPAKVAAAYRAAGIRDVKLKLYTGDRHEILNELDRENVYEDLLSWMEEKMKKTPLQ